jgi:hypothetical protein
MRLVFSPDVELARSCSSMNQWPQPEGLVPPRVLDALRAAQSGDFARAVGLAASTDPRDALSGGAVRLVHALAGLADDDESRARAELRTLSRHSDAAIALLATLARTEDAIAARRFAAASRPLSRLRARVRDGAQRVCIDASVLRVELARRGTLGADVVDALQSRLERRHPAFVHATVHVLRAERALLAGELPRTVSAHAEARPWVRSCHDAGLQRRHDDIARLLRLPFVDVEDWDEPTRTVSREDLAEIEQRNWQLWIDALHRRVVRRTRHRVETLSFARWPELWTVLEALARSPQRRLGWQEATTALEIASVDLLRDRVRRLSSELRTIGASLATHADGFSLRDPRFVVVVPTAQLPSTSLRLLGLLAAQPGARAAELRDSVPHSTIVHRLQRLRSAGYVRLVGGGREARYTLV